MTSLAMLAAAVAIPVTRGPFAEISSAQALPADNAGPMTITPIPALAPATPLLLTDDNVTASADAPAVATDRELECVAKVVRHEAGGEPRTGQLAVAQIIVRRMQSGRFPTTACGVANQRGQFFATDDYKPRRDTAWSTAIEVALEAMTARSSDVVPGAMFFRAAASSPNSFFRSRPRVGAIGGHIFYR